jgi:hypothetical protein
MTSAFFPEEELDRSADLSNAGTAVGVAARNQNHSGKSDAPIEGGSIALSGRVEIVGGVRRLGLLAVEIAVQGPAKKGGQNDSN